MDNKLFEELQQSLRDMETHAAGKKVKGVREVVKEVKAPSPLSKEDIVKLRKKLRVSQSAFAVLLKISTKTVQKMVARREPAKRIEPQAAHDREKESEDVVCELG